MNSNGNPVNQSSRTNIHTPHTITFARHNIYSCANFSASDELACAGLSRDPFKNAIVKIKFRLCRRFAILESPKHSFGK